MNTSFSFMGHIWKPFKFQGPNCEISKTCLIGLIDSIFSTICSNTVVVHECLPPINHSYFEDKYIKYTLVDLDILLLCVWLSNIYCNPSPSSALWISRSIFLLVV